MKIEKLVLRQFRNVRECVFEPSSHINFLMGANGQGKTSWIEALGYFATLRSFRGARSDEVILWGQGGAEIQCWVSPEANGSGDWRTELKLLFLKEGSRTSKTAFINGKPYRSSTSYLSQRFGQVELGFHAIIFNPADHDLVRGEPSLRRAYLDRVLAAEDLDYLKTLSQYQRLLDQRNSVLKSEERPDQALLVGFTQPMGKLAAIIARKRLNWLQRLSERLDDTSRKIAPKQQPLRVISLSKWIPEITNLSISNNDLDSGLLSGQGELPSLELLEQSFWNRLAAVEVSEWKSRSSLVGPHRDDWAFLLGSQFMKGHGSQGEVRSALLSLKLSEIDLFRKSTGHRPILLLDDFSSELDQERRTHLLKFLTDTDLQVFVTTTDETLYRGKRFWVSNGILKGLNEHDSHAGESERVFSG